MLSAAHIVAHARTLLGVPYMHQGHTRAGVDCGGFIRCLMVETGMAGPDPAQWPGAHRFAGYGRQPDGHSFIAGCDAYLDRIDDVRLSAVVALRFGGHPQHAGLIGDHGGGFTLIHALHGSGVVEHRLSPEWRSSIVATYAFRGIA